MTRQNDTTLSEQYDQKLRSELYAAMLTLQDKCADIHEAEQGCDEDKLEGCILALLDLVPDAVNSYFKCIDEGKHV